MSLLLLYVASVTASAISGNGSREHYGLVLDALIAEKNASQVIAKIAILQADRPVKTVKRNRQLRREIERNGLAWDGFYADLLSQARGQVLTEQIKAEYDGRLLEAQALQQQIARLVDDQILIDNNAALALLLLA